MLYRRRRSVDLDLKEQLSFIDCFNGDTL